MSGWITFSDLILAMQSLPPETKGVNHMAKKPTKGNGPLKTKRSNPRNGK